MKRQKRRKLEFLKLENLVYEKIIAKIRRELFLKGDEEIMLKRKKFALKLDFD